MVDKKNTVRFVIALVAFVCTIHLEAQTTISLDGTQSMSITGKGPGQDAVLNPYKTSESIAIVKNIGQNALGVRIQKAGKVILEKTLQPNQEQSFELEKGYELYLDSAKKSKALIDFVKKTT